MVGVVKMMALDFLVRVERESVSGIETPFDRGGV